MKYPIEHCVVTNWDDTDRHLASHVFPATVGRPKMTGIMVGMDHKVS